MAITNISLISRAYVSGTGSFRAIQGTTYDANNICAYTGLTGTVLIGCNSSPITVTNGTNSFVYPHEPAARNTFSGTLKDQNGSILRNTSVKLTDAYGNSVSAGTNLSDGSFSVSVEPGVYSMSVSSNGSGMYFTLAQDAAAPSIDLSLNNISQDLVIPTATVSLSLYNAQGYSSEGNASAYTANSPVSISLYPGGAPVVTATVGEPAGQLSYAITGGTGSFKSIVGVTYGTTVSNGICAYRGINSSGSFVGCNTSTYTVTSGTNHIDFPNAPAPRNIFSGTLKDQNGVAFNNTTIKLSDAYGNSVTSGVSSSGGSFSIAVEPGVYSMSMSVNNGGTNGMYFSLAQDASTPTIDLTGGSVVQNLVIPTATVNVSLYDNQGNIVRNGVSTAYMTSSGGTPTLISLYPGGAPVAILTVGRLPQEAVYPATNGVSSFKSIVGTTYGTTVSNGICGYVSSGGTLLGCNASPYTVVSGANSISVPKPAPPISLSATSPTYKPNLTWSSVTGAILYNVYRDGSKIATVSSTSYLDNSATVGAHSYYVTVLDSAGTESIASNTINVTVTLVAQTITFTSTAPTHAVVNGPTYTPTATASSGLPVAITVDSSSADVCTIVDGVVSFQHVGTCRLNANQGGNATYAAASQVQQSFGNDPTDQTIAYAPTTPTTVTAGGTVNTPTVTTTSGLPVTVSVDTSSSTVCYIDGNNNLIFLKAGTCTLNANQAGDTDHNPATQTQWTYTVNPAPQTITYTSPAPSHAIAGDSIHIPSTTTTSGLPVVLTVAASSASVCYIDENNDVIFLKPGTCTINANQTGDDVYDAAPQAQQSFTVYPADQTVAFTSTAPTAAVVGGATYSPTASATSGLPAAVTVDSSSSSVCSIVSGVVSFQHAGTCTLNANQGGNADYNAAPQVQQSFTVGKSSQTVAFTSTAPASAIVDGTTYTPTASATSGLSAAITVDSSSSSICSIVDGVVSFQHAGTCILNANQGGNADYSAAPQVQQSFTVANNVSDQTVIFTSTVPTSAVVGGTTYTPTATATSGLAVVITVDSSTSGTCSINEGVVSYQHAGTCTLSANQAGNSSYNAAPQVQQSFTVAKASQTVSFTSTAPSSAIMGGVTYKPTASATSGLTPVITVDSSSSSICTIDGSGNVSFQAAGTCKLDANQAGNTDYTAAPQVQQSFTVQASSNVNVATTITCPPTASVGTAITCTVTVTNTGPAAATSVITGINYTSNKFSSMTGTISGQGSLIGPSGGLVYFMVGTLASGATTTLTLHGTVSAVGSAVLNVTATTNSPDVNTANNFAGATIVIS
jgi:hypothetical protein